MSRDRDGDVDAAIVRAYAAFSGGSVEVRKPEALSDRDEALVRLAARALRPLPRLSEAALALYWLKAGRGQARQ